MEIRKPGSLSISIIEIVDKQIFMKDRVFMYFPIEIENCVLDKRFGIKGNLA